nr:Autotransporter adhesin EhaG [Paraburkholderia busanensis]
MERIRQARAARSKTLSTSPRRFAVARLALSGAALVGGASAVHAALPPDTAEYYLDVGAQPSGLNGAIASGRNALAIGPGAGASAELAIAIGYMTNASGPFGIALGFNAIAADNAALSLGAHSVAGANQATAAGYAARADGRAATAVGANAESNGLGSIALGASSVAAASGSIALGYGAGVIGSGSGAAIAIGQGAVAREANSVALGAGSMAAPSDGIAFVPAGASLSLIQGVTAIGQVSIGSAGSERRLTHVAAGANDTDAVNVSQLKAALSALDGTASSLDAAVTYGRDASGDIQRGNVTLGDPAVGGTAIHNVANGVDGGDAVNLGQLNAAVSAAIGGLVNNVVVSDGNANAFFSAAGDPASESAAASGAHAVAAGANAQATGSGALAIGAASGASGVNSVALGVAASAAGGSAIAVGANSSGSGVSAIALGTGSSASAVNASALGAAANAVAENSVALGQGSVADRANTVSVGSSGQQRQLANVAAGTQGTDAVNVEQMQQSVNGAVGEAQRYTNDQIRSARRDAYGGTAAAFAVAALPQAVLPGRGMMAVAGGTYGGQSALAIGVSQLSVNGKWAYRMQGTTDSRGQLGAALGAGMHW